MFTTGEFVVEDVVEYNKLDGDQALLIDAGEVISKSLIVGCLDIPTVLVNVKVCPASI